MYLLNNVELWNNQEQQKLFRMLRKQIMILSGGNKKNRIEFKESKEYKDAVEKIKSYPKRFKFTLPYYKMTKGQKNAMHIITDDCIKKKIIDSVSFGLDLTGNITEETFIRL